MTFVRHEARSAAGQTAVQEYAKAVEAMKRRKATDPTSWAYQAAIHGTFAKHLEPLWNQCEHQSWFFLPWHRMYVYYFEKIVRDAVVKAGGSPNWALPYWNYGLGGKNASLPEPFLEPANEQQNPLYVSQRNPKYNGGGELPPKVIDPGPALARPHYIGIAEFGGGSGPPRESRFWGYPGYLERTPHNDVHSQIGGLMGVPETAAQDPIFWLHHANIDRIWAIWTEARHRKNPTASQWLNHTFHFFDISHKQAPKACSEVEETSQLNYTYDPHPAAIVEKLVPPPPPPPPPDAPPPPSEPKFVGASEAKAHLVGESIDVPVEIDPRAREEVLEAANSEDPRRLYLNVEDIEGETNPSTVYGIYMNLEPEPTAEDLDRNYLGNLSFFGIEKTAAPPGDKAPHGMRVSVEVGDLIRVLRDDTDWDREHLRVSFRPLTPEPDEHAPIHIGRVSLSIDA